jgi:hypothetical protein
MAYKPVKRVVTVEFVVGPRAGELNIRVTPETVVARYHDTIVWDVQGLPAGLAKRISFGAFLPLEVPPRLRRRPTGLVPLKLRNTLKKTVPVKAVGKRYLAELDLGRTDVGTYKYDIEGDGQTLLDPDIEIRGPR